MSIKERVRVAAEQAKEKILSGSSIKEANEVFNKHTGFYLSHNNRDDFIKLVNFYSQP